jgi:hypothetical protein
VGGPSHDMTEAGASQRLVARPARPLHDRAMWRLRLPLAVLRQVYGRTGAIAWLLVMTAAVILLICIRLVRTHQVGRPAALGNPPPRTR